MEKFIRITQIFVLSSFTGWLYEISLELLINGTYADRGFLHLPVCPIYGFASLLLYAVCRKMRSPFVIAASGVILTTVTELGASYLTEWLFGIRLWDYSAWPMSFEWRISLVSSMIFGLLAVILMKVIVPITEHISEKKGRKWGMISSFAAITVMLADLFLCLRA